MMKGALGSKVPNHMAAAKLMELKCKIFGFVRERVEIATVDLKGSLEQARLRVLNIAPQHQQADLAVTGGADWTTRIPGN